MIHSWRWFLCAIVLGSAAIAQPTRTSIQVHAGQTSGSFPLIWNFFGYDEPNYTYAPNGKKLLREIAELSPTPAYIRVHNILTSGDGSASLKWGSTNAYTEDAAGKPVYDWKIVDKSGKTLAAVHHKIVAGASWTLDHRVDNVHNDNMVEFVKEHAK